MIRFLLTLILFSALRAEAAPRRIVCLNPVVCEWTAEILGPEATRSRVAGVSEYSDHPESLKGKREVGPYPKLNLEAIAGIGPDLVIGSSEYNLPDQLEQLKRLGLNPRILGKESFHSMESWIGELGAALGEREAASRASLRWRKLRESLQTKSGRKEAVFIEVQHSPLISVGGGSFLSEALEVVGYSNVFASIKSGYPKVSFEAVLRADPSRIFILDHAGNPEEARESKRDWERFRTLSAVRAGQVRLISGDDFARCTLRLLNALKRLRSGHEDRHP
jgi:ABC-type Fe3+-hydroxamate transport system substrate-binding protein